LALAPSFTQPPATRTLPSVSSVAVCPNRGTRIDPVAVQLPNAGPPGDAVESAAKSAEAEKKTTAIAGKKARQRPTFGRKPPPS